MLERRRRLRANIDPTLGERLVFAGYSSFQPACPISDQHNAIIVPTLVGDSTQISRAQATDKLEIWIRY